MYNLASKYNRLPSEIIDEAHELDSLTRFVINKVVTLFGMTIENALNEMVDVGYGANKHSESKYELSVLLDPAFRLPRPQPKAKLQVMDSVQAIMAMANQKGSGIKVWSYAGNDVKPS